MALVSKKNGKNWYYQCQYKDDYGKWRTKSFNTGVPKTHSSAREKNRAELIGLKMREEFLEQLAQEKQRLQGLSGDIDYSSYTLQQYALHWIEEIRHEVRDSTLYSYQQELNAHIVPILSDVKMKDINMQTVKFFFNTEFNDCLTKLEKNQPNYMQSIKKHLNTLSNMLDFAVSEYALEENPIPKIKKRLLKKLNQYKVEYEVEPYTWDELMELKDVVIASNVHIEAPVIIAIYTGLRREEILGLRWQDIDFDNRILHIRHTCSKVGTKIVYAERTKTKGSRRTVPFAKEFYDYLLELKNKQEQNKSFFGDGYISTDLVCVWPDGKPIKPDNVSRRFKKLIEDNNLRKITFRDIRHSYGSVIFNATGDIKVVSDLLGHSNISTTSDIYVHTDDNHKIDVINGIHNGN